MTNQSQTQLKLITASLRKNSNGKPTVQVNLRPNLIAELNLKATPFVELTKSKDRYKLRFLPKASARTRKIAFKESYATVGFPPETFKLENQKDPVSRFPIDAEYVDGLLEFEFDADEFVKRRPAITDTKKISSAEDKVAAGFKPDTAWGVKVQTEMDERIEKAIREAMKRKFMEDELVVQTEFPSYGKIIHGYASIKVGGKQ